MYTKEIPSYPNKNKDVTPRNSVSTPSKKFMLPWTYKHNKIVTIANKNKFCTKLTHRRTPIEIFGQKRTHIDNKEYKINSMRLP